MPATSFNKKNIVAAIFLLTTLAFVALALRPLPQASINNCTKHAGIVAEVEKGNGKGDIVIKLKGNNSYYYMNRAIDNGYSVASLKDQLMNKEVELLTISHWTPLDPFSRTKHVAEITVNQALIYSEM